MIGLGLKRPLVAQTFNTFSFAVGAGPLPIQPNAQPQDLITTFIISNPIGGASVFLGGQGVTITTGLEIIPGTAPVFISSQVRQLYELQVTLLDIAAGLNCTKKDIAGIPFVVWDMSKVFLVAAAATTVTVALFPEMYI